MNKKLLKTICISLSIIISMAMMSGFTSQSKTAAKNSTKSSTEQVTLRFSWWGSDARHKATLAAFDLYTKKHPNVKIEGEYGGNDGYQQKILTQIAGGTAPDIIQLDKSWYPDLVAQGDVFVDLFKEKALTVVDMEDKKFLKDSLVYDGKLLGVPSGINDDVFMYNKDFYARNNISPNTVWTWDNLLYIGKRVHAKNPKDYLLAISTWAATNLIQTYVSQKTGNTFLKPNYTLGFDKATLAKGFSYFKSLIVNGVVPKFQESVIYDNKSTTDPKWINGNEGNMIDFVAAMSAYTSGVSFKVGITQRPIAALTRNAALSTKPPFGYSINKASKHKDEAVAFLNWFLTSEEAVKTITDTRGVPAIQSSRKILVDNNLLNPEMANALTVASKFPNKLEPNIPGNETSKVFQDMVQKVAYGLLTPDQAAEQMIKGYNDILTRIKK